MSQHWQPDDYTQTEADYSGGSEFRSPRRRSGKRSKAAQAAKMRRWRQRHRAHIREYDRTRKAAVRAAARS